MDDGDEEEDDDNLDPDTILNDASEDATPKYLKPFYDKTDRVFRCFDCGFEVCDGVCQAFECAQKHTYEVRVSLTY